MKKNLWVLLIVSLVLLLGMTDCGNWAEAKTAGGVVIYSPCSEDIINTIIPMFEKETGIKVDLITAGTGELVKRLESERHNPYADIMFGGSPATLVSHVDLFEEYVSPNDEFMMEHAKNETGFFTPFNADGSVILVNKNIVGDIEITGYADLLNPKLKGRIAHADPASSSSAYYQLTNMLLAMGDGEDYFNEDAWKYVEALIKNLDGKVASGSGVVHRSVADGEYIVGLTYEDPAVSYVRDGASVEVVYAKEGVVFMNATVAIVKGSKNRENAEKFVDFIISEKAQNAFGTQLTNRPLRAGVKLGDHMKPMEEMNLIHESQEACLANKQAIVKKYIDLFVKLQD